MSEVNEKNHISILIIQFFVLASLLGIPIFSVQAADPIATTPASDGSLVPDAASAPSTDGTSAAAPQPAPAGSATPNTSTSTPAATTSTSTAPATPRPTQAIPTSQPVKAKSVSASLPETATEEIVATAPLGQVPPGKSSTNLFIMLGAGIAGLFGGTFVFVRAKKKNNKKDDPCQEIKDELEQKKSDLKSATAEISIKERMLKELKKKAEDKEEQIKDRAIRKAKEITKKRILRLEEEGLTNRAINALENAAGIYGSAAEKIEQLKEVIEALKIKQQGATEEIRRLESSYKTCRLGNAGAEAIKGAATFNLFHSNPTKITYFVHGTTTDNEKDISSGWSAVELSELGVTQSIALKEEIKEKKFDVVFCSDLKRAVQSAKLAFGEDVKIIPDARLRECNYGTQNGQPSEIVEADIHDRIANKFPEGESYEDVKARIADFLKFVRKNYAGKNVAIVAHKAPQLSLDVLLKGKSWQQAFEEDWRKTKAWKPGWEYELT
jgi:broad specificity phosphatase PhoE